MNSPFLTFSLPATLLAAALGASAPARADAVFPPPHLAAGATLASGTATPVAAPVQPWYFQGQAQREAALRFDATLATTVTIRPWYRAAN